MSRDEAFMHIGGHRMGGDAPLFVIAEIGLNHGGSLERALEMVDAAAAAGVGAVKLQTVVASEFVAPSPLRDFFAAFELDEAAHHAIAARARGRGVALISTPLSESAVDLLERVGVDAYKIASGDLTWTPLIERCARTGKPVIMSTGLARLDEIEAALDAARNGGATEIALLHCVASYPVPQGSENLRAIATLADAFDVPVGLSDHSADLFAVPIAVALGASLYERHFILDGDSGAVDAAVSSSASEFADLIRVAVRTRCALGSGVKACLPAEKGSLASRRGLYAARPLRAGHTIARSDVIALRPAAALASDDMPALVGTRLTRDVAAGAPFLMTDLEGVRGA
jgi:sialic acid synthase SpsE